jgi:acetylornithine/succinyldiaminopimelate/putrescine aminotransferase
LWGFCNSPSPTAHKGSHHVRALRYVCQVRHSLSSGARACDCSRRTARRYLDFHAGIAVNALGHPTRTWWRAEVGGRKGLAHLKRLHHSRAGAAGPAAGRHTFADACFFTNSGTEAIECAIKTARHYFWAKGETDRYEIIAFTGSFHGRTLGAIAAGGNPHYLEGFGPPLAGFKHVAPGDLKAVEARSRRRPAPSSSSPCRARAASPP